EVFRSSATRPERLSDHDPVVAYFSLDTPPVCNLAVPTYPPIYPLDHGMRNVTITNVTDADGDPVAITVTGICQDEPPNAENVPAWAVDGAIVNPSTAAVRAERSGTRVNPGNGRVYHVFFTAADGHAGGTCQGEVKIQVPTTAGGTSIDDGATYDSMTGNVCRPP